MHIVLKYQLQKCSKRQQSIQSAFSQLLQCIEASVYRCVFLHEPLGREYITEVKGACGVINQGQQLRPYTWTISVHSKYSLSINFLHFHLPALVSPRHLTCEHIAVLLRAPGYPERRYCGYRMPWTNSISHPYANIIFFKEQELLKGYYFVITFEAFDISLPSVGIIHEIVRKDVYPCKFSQSLFIATNTDFSIFSTKFQIYFVTHATNQIVVKYPTTTEALNENDYQHFPNKIYLMNMSDVRLYDGPGILSPKIASSCNTTTGYCTCYFSSFLGLLEYRISVPSNFESGYGWHWGKLSDDHLKQQGIIWSSKLVSTASINCIHQGDSINFNGKSGICLGHPLLHNQVTIHFVHFRGYDTHVVHSQPCSYGGLYVLNVGDHVAAIDNDKRQRKICLNVSSAIVMPSNKPPIHHKIRMAIVFKTFKGYSDGSAAFTMFTASDCVGWNRFMLSTYACIFSVWHRKWKDMMNKHQKTKCTEYWFTHYPAWNSTLENCAHEITFGSLHKSMQAVGSFQFIVSGSVIYQHITNWNHSHTMVIEALIVKDFPVDLSTEKKIVNLKLQTTAAQTFFLNAGNNLHVRFNYTGVFQQYVLSVRIKILENVVYTPLNGPNLPNIAHIHTLDSTISDVYLSPIHRFRGYLVKYMNHTGHNSGSCRLLVKGQTCSQRASYKVIRIHQRLDKKLEAAHRIQIATKRTLNCSCGCPLDVAIWEIITIGSTTQLRCHEWRGIYHLTWRVAVSSRGFSVHINATCNTTACSNKLCDVAVSFSHMVKWKISYFPPCFNSGVCDLHIVSQRILAPLSFRKKNIPFHEMLRTDITSAIPLNLSKLVFGSWNDAHKYCRSKTLYLATPKPNIIEQIKYTVNLLYEEHGWNHSSPYILAGLHRKMVRKQYEL